MIMARQPVSRQDSDGGQPPRFEAGQLVRHRRYGYRGVVVHVDPICRADDAWYFKNLTQPDRNQAWYHVLVDASTSTTYAAEENLTGDESGAAVSHPLIETFFVGFQDGRYTRNEQPWV